MVGRLRQEVAQRYVLSLSDDERGLRVEAPLELGETRAPRPLPAALHLDRDRSGPAVENEVDFVVTVPPIPDVGQG